MPCCSLRVSSLFIFFFFFSSRRRHTRLQGDWSSDVCSSDLICSCAPGGSRGGSIMAGRLELGTQPGVAEGDSRGAKSRGSLDADIIIANAPDPVFVSDLEGKILQANDAVSQLLGFRQDEVLEQSLSRFISPEETREFTAALREVVERGVMRN